MYSILQHRKDFENIYRDLDGMKGEWNFQFPLDEIERFDWRRGRWTNEYYYYFYRRFSSHILSRLLLENGQKILVIGCGFGFDEKNIKTINGTIELWSIDISEEMLQRALKNHSPSHFSMAMAEKLPFADSSFDRVLAREVIEHVIDPKAMLQEIGRVLKKGGRAVITTENSSSLAPSNGYDVFIKPKITQLLRVTLQKPPYKNETLAINQVRTYAKEAGLALLEYFWDGAMYKYLPEWASLLKRNLPRIAHYFSCLENNRGFAKRFCDQVKYVFVQEENRFNRKPISPEVFWVCLFCKSKLKFHPTFIECPICNKRYRITKNIPNFLAEGVVKEKDDPLDRGERIKGKSPIVRGLRMIYIIINPAFRLLYSYLYVGLALLATLVVKKNNPQLSHILSKDDVYQKYIKIY